MLGLLLAACGDGDGSAGSAESGDQPTVVATTSILGDVLEHVAGDQVDVVTIMPVGADPHSFQASARQANQMREADALVVNGAGFEEGLGDIIDSAAADGTPTFEAVSAVEPLDPDEASHDHDGQDPHFFTDPARMAESVDAMAEFLVENVDGVDAAALRASADDYITELESLDREIEQLLADIPEDRRVLVTNHEVFGHFAERYGFEVVGTVVPSGSTADGASAGALADLAEVVAEEGVPAIFADTSSSDELADTLAGEVGGDVEVVELFSESLGDESSGGATYVEMMRTNAERIAEALSA